MSLIPLTAFPRFSSVAPAPRVNFQPPPLMGRARDENKPVTCFRVQPVRTWSGRSAEAPRFGKFQLRSASLFADALPIAWTVKGLFPERGLGLVYGAPGAGKSFLMLDVACAIAQGNNWLGRKTRRAPVVYLCLEGERGFAQRILAWEHANGKRAPELLMVIADSFHLHNSDDTVALSQAIVRWVKTLPSGLACPVVIVDTLNRAMPGCEENGSADMGRSLEGCAVLQKATGGLVLLVHHSGKDTDKGPRGHSSLQAAADASIFVGRNAKGRFWESKKVKDGTDDIHGAFDLIQVSLGQDDDGDPVTSCVIQELETCPLEKEATGLSAPLKLALSTLRDAVGPMGLSVDAQLDLGSWRSLFYTACPASSDSGKRNAFVRARKDLLEAGFIVESGQAITITATGLAQINSLAKEDATS